ncbi:putative ribonuclease H-like domain-containing protein, partial [Tanacetum coccineum]
MQSLCGLLSRVEGLNKAYDRFQKLISQLEVHVFEVDIKSSSGSSSNSQNVAFLSAEDTNSINEVNTTNGVSTTAGYSSQVQASSSSYTDDLMFSFFANQSNSPQLDYKDLEQIDHDDLEEIDLKWDNTRRTVPVETSDALVVQMNALIVQDGLGYDWSYIAQDEPSEFALMAYTSRSDTEKNEAVYEKKIAVLEFEVKDNGNAVTRLTNQLEQTLKEKEDLKAKLEQFETSSKNLNKLINSQISTKDKIGLGYGDQLNKNDLSGSELFNSVFDSRSSDGDDNQTNDRFKKDNGYHAVPPPLTRNYMPSLADLSFAGLDDSVYRPTTNKTSASVSQVSDDDEDIFQSNDVQTTVKPSFKKIEFTKARNEPVKSDKQAVKPRMVTQSPKVDRKDWNGKMTQKLGLGFGFTKKACFVCGSHNHLIKDCDFHEKRMHKESVLGKGTGHREVRPIWNNTQRINHQNKFVPTAVLTRSGRIPVSTAKQYVNTATPKNRVNVSKSKINTFPKSHSPIRRPFYKSTVLNTRVSKVKVNTVKVNGVNTAGQTTVCTVKGNGVTAVKASAGCVWRPKMTDLNNGSKDNSGSWISKRGNPQQALKYKGMFDSGCSRHMTGNKALLTDYQDIDGGFVAFGGSTRGGKITGIGKIRTNKIDFEDVFFVKELKFNLFSVSQMCDKKNSVLFTETECLVLSPDFKLIDESQVLLRVPRQNNMYSFDLKNVVPSGDLTCLFAKATIDESNWKIIKEEKMGYIQIIRADGIKHGNTRPEEAYERVLWGDLKVMFELDVESEVWRNLQGYNVTVWKLFSFSGVHFNADAEIKEKNSANTEIIIEEEQPTELVEDIRSGEKGASEVSTVNIAVTTAKVSTAAENLVYISEGVLKRKKIRKRLMRIAKGSEKLEVHKEINKAGQERVVAKDDQAHVIDWSDPAVLRYHAQLNRPYSVAEGKQHKASCKSKIQNSISQPIFMLHMDLFGPSSLMHKKYGLVVTDDYSRYTWVFFLATKDETTCILKKFIIEIENLVDKKVKIIRCDNGTEFKNSVMNDFCAMKGIRREFSVARTPQQNGVAERRNRTLIEAARTMLADSKLPTTFWAKAVNTACYVQNRVLVVKPYIKTPYELFRGRTPALSFMRPFGCHVTILNTLDYLSKFDGKSDEGFFVGYLLNSNRPEWLFDIDMLTKSMNYVPVVAGTNSNDSAGTKDSIGAGQSSMETRSTQDCIFMPIWKDGSPLFDSFPKISNDAGSLPSGDTGKKHDEVSDKESGISNELNSAFENLNNEYPDDPKMPGLETIETYDDYEEEVDFTNLESSIHVSPTPTTRIHKNRPLKQVIGSLNTPVQTRSKIKPTNEQGFISAVYEGKTHEDLNTCLFACFLSQIEPTRILVDLPKGKKAIGTKWVFRNKKDERGIVFKNKARLVTQGYTQEEGIDYNEVFAPVARIEAIMLFLAYASFMGFMVYKMDVKSAFIYGRIEEEVYVCQPPGFEDSDHPDNVYKVVKALYGLHQAPRAWYETLAKYLLGIGFHRGKIDQTLFIKRQKGDILLVQVYVDDISFGSTKKELCIKFEKLMKDKFQMSFMRELTFFLGLQVKQKKDGIFISQDKYVAEVLRKFNFSDVKSASTPVDTKKNLVKDANGDDVDVHLYKSMIGSLMYLTASRPDIIYLKGQPKLGLWYPRDTPFELVAYTDSDYAGASLDRKSTTRGCRFLGSKLISWQCKKQ